MSILKIAAFCDGHQGGNPAGIVIDDSLPSAQDMQRIAAEVGFSETVFATRLGSGWRVRYFSPSAEVPFCGHATIALGAALALQDGDGIFALTLNETAITVEGTRSGDVVTAALQSPLTRSQPVAAPLVAEALALLGFKPEDLDARIPPARAHAGADHLVLMLSSRAALAGMRYDLEAGRALMTREGWVTVLCGFAETPQQFHVRNAFAYGGVYEDPATGAGAAALAGYLRDIAWPHRGHIDIIQGEDMGIVCRLRADISPTSGSSIRVSGTARMMQD